MIVILTSAPAKPCAAAKPPNPAPTMTTWCVMDALLRFRRLCRDHSITGGDPGIETAQQGPDPLEAVIHQDFGDARRRGFARAAAVQDDVPIARQLLELAGNVLQRNMQGTGNPTRLEIARRDRPHIDDDGRGAS